MAPEPKSIVDISGLFKYSKVHDVSSRHHPKAPKFEHVLAQQFSQSIEHSRETIVEEALSSVELSHGNLIDDIAAFDDALIKERDQDTDLQKPLGKPLSDVELEFNENSKRFKIPISKRLEDFSVRSDKVEQKLVRYWKEWEAIQNRICAFGEEVLGLQAANGGGSTVAERLKEENERFSHGIITERTSLEEEIESMCQETINRMKDIEKELTISTRKQNRNILEELDILGVDI